MWKIIFLLFLGITARNVKGELELGDDCEEHEDCEDIANAICGSSDLCECKDGFLASSDNFKCLPMATKVGDACEVAEQCESIPGADCKNNTCTVLQEIPKPPVLSKPSDECMKDSDCPSFLLKKVCKNGTCVMDVPSVSPKSILTAAMPEVFVLGKPCGNDTDCTGEGSTCTDKQCKCKEDFVPSQNLKSCLPKAKSVGDKCSETAQCITLNGSICENEKCTQKLTKMFTNLSENLPPIKIMIGTSCQSDKECEHLTNALCLEKVCQCKDNYVTSLTSSSCLEKAKKEGDPCEIDKQCEDVKGATCIQKKCVKPGIIGTKLGKANGSATIAISQLLAAILLAKSFLL